MFNKFSRYEEQFAQWPGNSYPGVKSATCRYIDPPFNSDRNHEDFWGETKEKRAFEDRYVDTRTYIKNMRPRCVELTRSYWSNHS